MIAAMVLAGWLVLAIVAAVAVGPVLRRNARRSPPSRPWLEVDMPMTKEQERQLYIDYKRTAAMQPGGFIVSRRA